MNENGIALHELTPQVMDLLARTGNEWLPAEEAEERLIWSDHTHKLMRLNQPLLVIALGGSGRVIATGMKAGFIETYGSLPENVKFLAFDSANDPVDRQESRSGRIVRLEADGEFFLLDRVPVAGLKQNPARHRAIMTRMGNTVYKIRRPSIHNGAVQERPQGWLAFAWSYAAVRRQIENCIRQLTGRADDLRDEINRQPGINILIVGSIPGGQGSGSILDTAYLVRHVLENLGEQADASRVIGMLVLPGAFVGLHEGNLKPNAYAFKLELDYLMRSRRFEGIYPDGTAFVSYESPFDQTVVLEGVDEQGRSYQDHGEVCTMGAQSMVMLLGTDVGQKETMDAINARYAIDREGSEDDTNYLSTVGQAVLRFPARIVAKRCTLHHALTMVESYLLAPVSSAQAAALRPLSGVGAIRERLQTDEHDAPHRIELVPPASLEQIKPEEVPNQARALYRNFLDRRIHNDVFVGMKNKAAALEPELRHSLEGEFAVLVERAQIPLIQRWLEVARQGIEAHIANWNADLDRLAEEISEDRAALDSAATVLDQAAASFPGIPFADRLRRGRVRPALALYIDEINRHIAIYVAQRSTELGIEILRRLLHWLEEQQRTVQLVALRLQQTRDRLSLREAELGRLTGGRHEINLADEELVTELYREHAGQVEPYVQEAITTSGGLLTWTQLRPDQLGSLLAQAASVAFRTVREISVEQILKRRWNERSLQGWVSRLESLAAGAWNLDRSLLPGGGSGLADFTLLGVPDANNTLFAGTDRTLISTYDNERIVALRTIYGASFGTLRSTQKWRAAYEAAVGHLPLHVLPSFVQDDDRSIECFALAIVFDQVERTGNWFYFKSQDPLEDNLRLGHGLEKAIATFADQPDLCHRVDDFVDRLIARYGTNWATEKIDGYVSAGSPKDDEVTQKLRKAARAYANELRRNAQATLTNE
jgi:hypothetical protein